jgi:hypothetical protein
MKDSCAADKLKKFGENIHDYGYFYTYLATYKGVKSLTAWLGSES